MYSVMLLGRVFLGVMVLFYQLSIKMARVVVPKLPAIRNRPSYGAFTATRTAAILGG